MSETNPTSGRVTYRSENGVAIITLDRPLKRNAMTSQMCDELRGALERLRDGDDRVGLLCAQGDIFCAGADLTDPPPNFWRAVPGVGLETGKPLIAAVQGAVVGLALTIVTYADLCVAEEDTRFLYPEAKVGVSKGLISGLSVRVPHKIAMELMLMGGPLTAQRAYDVGFVNRVVPNGQAVSVAQEMADALVQSAPLVLKQLRQLVNETLPSSPAEVMYRTAELVERVTGSADALEGVKAFHERRTPRFEGR